IRNALPFLRARARHEAQNNDHARGFLREVKTNVVGPRGISLQSKARNGNRQDKRVQSVIEESWKEWGELGSCDVTGRLAWTDIQLQAIETVARDGEAVYRMVDGWDNSYGFALQAIDPELLDVQYNVAAKGEGNSVVMGIELDMWGRHVAYYFTEPDQSRFVYRTERKRKRVDAKEIVFVHLPEWMCQTRGVPWMATALRRLNDLEGYDESAVVAARSGAAKMGFYKQTEDAQPILTEAGESESGLTDGEDSGGQLFQSFEPNSIGILPFGVEFQGWDPSYPHSEHGNFTKAVLRGIATGLGVSYNTLANDLEGVNYSSLRAGAIVERAAWMLLQEWFIRSFHTPIFNKWIGNSLSVGALVDPRGRPLRLEREREFRRVHWQARRWQWVDPLKESQAAEKEIGLRIRSISSVIRERGEDPETVWEEIKAEREQLEALGIEPSEAMAAAQVVPVTEDEDETDGDDVETEE
ncbi:MAG TPA: phage portal protein, partial [Hyphomicrobiaceae bacterium]|nr:phage portal protein [Hyphomicrobiaceae bacterium]